MRPGGLEGHVTGVHRVGLPVRESDAQVNHRVARDAALRELRADSLLHTGDVLTWDRAADHAVDELEPSPALEGFDGDVGHGVLTVTPALLDMPPMTDRVGDKCLSQRDLQRLGHHVDAITVP